MIRLLEYLSSLPEGPILDTGELAELLADCWGEFDGGGAEGMAGYKLPRRMERVDWHPPFLTFRIERHGGTILGSTRAEVHEWALDTDKKTACCSKVSRRQIKPAHPRLDVGPLAEEIFQLIARREGDGRLKWGGDGRVRVLVGKILPEGSVPKQTLEGHRKRFREALSVLLVNAGWNEVRHYVYTLPAAR